MPTSRNHGAALVVSMAGLTSQPLTNPSCPSEEFCQHAPRADRIDSEDMCDNLIRDAEMDGPAIADADSGRHVQVRTMNGTSKSVDANLDDSPHDSPSPAGSIEYPKETERRASPGVSSAQTGGLLSPYSLDFPVGSSRFAPNSTCSFLRPGTKFHGSQQSDRRVHDVQVEIKHVDMAESFLCGYLRIQGLTDDNPTLTTYFEGEIIGSKYTFLTKHTEWGSSEKTDMIHWNRFPAWKPLAKQAKRPDFTYKNHAQREHVFMRWKERFLVPDHKVRAISGASFEGFYYICFNQITGSVSGIYFHAKSEKYQQLELKHVDDRGCSPVITFR